MTATATSSRRATTRSNTRARLLHAASALIGEGGFDAVTIAELTQRADVGFGTFYGYFESKEAVVREVILDAMASLADANDERTSGLTDPAEVVASAIRHTLATADEDPIFAGFITRVGLSGDETLWTALRQRLRRDIDRGVSTGRFVTDAPSVVGHMIEGSVLSVLRAKLAGELDTSADLAVAASALQLLGIPATEATEISTRGS
jgi:AcrR family transcriptional regulator